MGPSARERRPVHRLTYDHSNINKDMRMESLDVAKTPFTMPTPPDPSTSTHLSGKNRVGRPSNMSSRTLTLLNTWAPANKDADQVDVVNMYNKFKLTESLPAVRKWFTNFKYRQSDAYQQKKTTYKSNRRIKRQMAKMNGAVQSTYTDILLHTQPPPPAEQTSTASMQEEDNVQVHNHDEGLSLLTETLLSSQYQENVDDFLQSLMD